MTADAGLLSGVRVLDLTNVLAGPYCTYQLALQGADVLKIELPGTGDLARHLGVDAELNRMNTGSSFLAQNAGKRSMTLNLKHPEGKEIFGQLIDEADVLVENFRPGVLASLGFGWEELRARNSRLVYCAISGFGADGPMSQRPAYDQIVQGLSGMMHVTGQADGGPTRVGFPVCDTFGGMTGAFAIAAALVRRERDGNGAYLDISLLDSAVSAMGWTASNWLIGGREPERMGNDNFTASPSGTFATADGLLNIAANQQAQYEALCEVVGRVDLISDNRFATRTDRLENRSLLSDDLTHAFSTRTAKDWEELLNPVGVPAAQVLTVPEACHLDQLEHRKVITDLGPIPGRNEPLLVVTTGFRVDGKSVRPRVRPPALGEHTDRELAKIGVSGSRAEALRKDGAV
jgi:crotonobetainyl-CoA:carnitine CoA-transferase CaiB-like acyl-CoA transferase